MAFTTDNQLWEILIGLLDTWASEFLIEFGQPVVVARSYQPQQFDVPEDLVLFISKIHSKRYGFQASKDKFNTLSGKMDHTERYILNETYQIDTQATSNPNQTVATIRAGDVAESASVYLQSSGTIQAMLADGLEILRIENIRHNHFLNDFNRFEPAPSFDFTIAYTQEVITEEDPLFDINGNLFAI